MNHAGFGAARAVQPRQCNPLTMAPPAEIELGPEESIAFLEGD